MSREQHATRSAELKLREVRARVQRKDFRTKSLVVVTTLVDAEEFPAEEIAALYRQRWQAELNLRSLKTVLQMDCLRCKSPDSVSNELRRRLVGYNLIRCVMAVAAMESGRSPWKNQLQGSAANSNQPAARAGRAYPDRRWCAALVGAVAAHTVGHRPDRYEPRVKKRRPKKYKLMREPRQNYRRRMGK